MGWRSRSAEEMSGAHSFQDISAGEYIPAAGFLNRRSEIFLEDPGGCRVARGDVD